MAKKKSKVVTFIDTVLPAKEKPKHRVRNSALVIGAVSAAAAVLNSKTKGKS